MSTPITAQQILRGSDRLHQMDAEINRIIQILCGVLGREIALTHSDSFICIPVFKYRGLSYELEIVRPENEKKPVAILLGSDHIKRIQVKSIWQPSHSIKPNLATREIVQLHANLDKVVQAAIVTWPGIRAKLEEIASQAN